MSKIALGFVFMLPVSAFASTIAVIDSGSDFKHVDLVGQYAINAHEIAGNKQDDDKDGYIDDVYGYNFAEKKADVIDYSYLGKLKPFMPDIRKFFEVQTRILDKTVSDEDKAWMKFMQGQEGFIKQLGIFGNFAHGTHVTGITAGVSTTKESENHPFAVKIIPTEVKLPFSALYQQSAGFRAITSSTKVGIPAVLRRAALSLGLRYLAKMQTKVFAEVGKYVNVRGADVANGSFGTGYKQLGMIVENLYNMVFQEDERSKEDLDEMVREYAQQILINARAMPLAAPKTLFVFAAGNDGSDNDALPCSPANLREDNTITVAATLRNREIAVFSNYGATKVDVAAPGVGIRSTYPGDDHGQMSGTSQAAPYVSYLAGAIKNLNPKLSPLDIKAILMGTVDMKDWLATKVKAGGFVNADRAREAAALTKEMPLWSAITAARHRVRDLVIEEKPEKPVPNTENDMGFMIVPLVSPIN